MINQKIFIHEEESSKSSQTVILTFSSLFNFSLHYSRLKFAIIKRIKNQKKVQTKFNTFEEKKKVWKCVL